MVVGIVSVNKATSGVDRWTSTSGCEVVVNIDDATVNVDGCVRGCGERRRGDEVVKGVDEVHRWRG